MRILLSTLVVALVALSGCDTADPTPTDSASSMDPFDIYGGPAYYYSGRSGTYGCTSAFHFEGNGVDATGWAISGDGTIDPGINSAFVTTTGVGSIQLTVSWDGGQLTETFPVTSTSNSSSCI